MDRVTELQNLVDQLGIMMIQQFDQLSPNHNPAAPQSNGKLSQQQIETMAAQIIGTSKAIDDYLDSLPAIEGKQQEQLDRIAQLETENKQYEEEILRLSTLAESKLANIRSSLSQIAQDQLNLADGA